MKTALEVLLTAILLLVRIPLMISLWIVSSVSGVIHDYSTRLLDWVDDNVGGITR